MRPGLRSRLALNKVEPFRRPHPGKHGFSESLDPRDHSGSKRASRQSQFLLILSCLSTIREQPSKDARLPARDSCRRRRSQIPDRPWWHSLCPCEDPIKLAALDGGCQRARTFALQRRSEDPVRSFNVLQLAAIVSFCFGAFELYSHGPRPLT